MRRRTWAGLATVAVFLLLVVRFWHPVFGFTSFLQLDHSNDARKIEAFRTHPVYVYRARGSYDGIAYAQIAYHPDLRARELRRAVDTLSYRARRILPPAAAWLLAAGRPGLIAQVYAALNVAAWLIFACLLWRGLPVVGARSWTAWCGFLFSAGALACVRLALTDLIATLFIAAAYFSAERCLAASGSLTPSPRRPPNPDEPKPPAQPTAPQPLARPAIFLALACLSRETSLLAIPALWTRPLRSRRNLLLTLIAALPLALWLLYIRHVVGPGESGWGNFTWPVAGLVEKWRDTLAALGRTSDESLPLTTLLALAGLCFQGGWLLVRRRPDDPWWRLGALFLVELLLLGASVWEDFPGAAFRAVLPLTLAFTVLAARWRASWAALAIGNLTVFAGLVALRDRPSDPKELAAARSEARACVVTEGRGWFDVERSRRQTRAWTAGGPRGSTASMEFQVWPAGDAAVKCRAEIRGEGPQRVTAVEEGRVLWSGAVGREKEPVAFDVSVRGGHAEVMWRAADPGVREPSAAGGRMLAFALYDLKVTFADAGADPH